MAAEGEGMTVGTIRSSQAKPPAAFVWILGHLLSPEDRETVFGDLLEEYRESKRPALGTIGANRWFSRQVAGFFWRLVWPAFVMVACYWVGGVLISNLYTRGAYGVPRFVNNLILVLPMLGMWIGLRAGRCSRRSSSGAIVAGVTALILGYLVAALWMVLALWAPAVVRLSPPVPVDVLIVPLAGVCGVALISAIFGLFGGAIGAATAYPPRKKAS